MNWKKQVVDFKKSLSIEKSSRYSTYIRFGFFGLVGGGKSVTAGIFAIGITPEGKIGWIDGEGKRSGFAIDQVADMAVAKYGGDKQSWVDRFEVVHIEPPFNPLRVIAAIEILEDFGCKTVIADILTQAWDSDGGYLDLKHEEAYNMAEVKAKDKPNITEQKHYKLEEKAMQSAAAHIKPWTHGKLVSKINTSKCNMVLLFQAKQKYNAKTYKVDEYVTPIQESGLSRVALAVGRVEVKMVNGEPQGGFCTFRGAIEHGTKFTHPKIWPLLPKNGEQFHFSHAEAIAQWCQVTSKQPLPGQNNLEVDPPTKDIKALKATLWKLTLPFHGGDRGKLEKWLKDKAIIQADEKLEKLTESQLEVVIDKAVIVESEIGGGK